jgi:hypothetical protein
MIGSHRASTGLLSRLKERHMSESIAIQAEGSFRERKDLIEVSSRPAHQAYQILHITYAVVPIITGVDKFFHLLCNWDLYLAPVIARLSPIGGHSLMLVIGVVEIIAGLVVAFKPKYGGYLVAAWLWGIIINLFLIPGFFDVAFRDFGLSLGALALARLSREFSS